MRASSDFTFEGFLFLVLQLVLFSCYFNIHYKSNCKLGLNKVCKGR